MRIKGQDNIAALFGVAPKTITEWQVMGFPVAVQGGPGIASEYDGPACIAWLVDREVRKVRSESPKDRLARLQGDKLEQEMLVSSGQLIPAAEVEPLWEAACITAREYLLGEATRIAALVVGMAKPDVETLLESTFAAYLARLAAWKATGNEDDDAELPASADDDPEA